MYTQIWTTITKINWLSVPIRDNVKTILHKNANNFISTKEFDLKFYKIS